MVIPRINQLNMHILLPVGVPTTDKVYLVVIALRGQNSVSVQAL